MQGPDAGEKQMRLFSILCCCAMAPALETLPTPFPLLLSMGVGTTICIVIYKLCRTLLGPTCINLGFALAFLFPLASLQHSFCLSCLSASLSSAGSGVLFPRTSVCAAAMLLLQRESFGNELPMQPGPGHTPAVAARCLSTAHTAGTADS